MNMISLVLPIRIDKTHPVSDLDRFLAAGLPSLEQCMDRDAIAELLVIAAKKDTSKIRRSIVQQSRLPLRVIAEEELCPELDGLTGWFKQQVLKLAAAQETRSKWYLTLDADVVCVRPLGSRDLFPDGRAVCHREPASLHIDWWRGSKVLLDAQYMVELEAEVMGVTPALMHAPSVMSLARHLGEMYPQEVWTKALMSRTSLRWSEYSLYWTYLLENGLTDQLYYPGKWMMYGAESIWKIDDVPGAEFRQEAAGAISRINSAPFVVLQSNMGLPLGSMVRLARRVSECVPEPSVFARIRWLAHGTSARVRRMMTP